MLFICFASQYKIAFISRNMTARSNSRRGIRTHRKRPTHRRQRKRQTHRKRRAHHKRQRGGADVIYFNEAFAEHMTAEARLAYPDKALEEEEESGFLSNYYTRFIDGLPQDNIDVDTGATPNDLKRAKERFIKENIIGFIYDEHWFANSEQALAFAKAKWMNPNGNDDMSKRLIDKILTTYNPDTVKIIGSTQKGLPAADGLGNYKIIFAREPSDHTSPDSPKYVGALFKDWADANLAIMEEIQMAKYSPIGTDKQMSFWLKNTGNATLAEAAKDPYWGIGMVEADAKKAREDGLPWPGKNNLGIILENVRRRLQ